MRIAFAVVAVSLLCSSVGAMNILPKTKDDHRSFDVVVRRVESGTPEDLIAVLRHMEPILDRYGGRIGWPRIALGSEDEFELVCRQLARSKAKEDGGDIASDLAVHFVWKIWYFIVKVFDTVIPGLGSALPIIVALYLWVRYKDKVLKAIYKDAEKLPVGQRKEVFTSPEVKKDYEKRIKKGQL